ncbi:MAG: hypothetical protein NTZ21_00105 [Actinobacteria bacterium]|nr:hypothetical protein [Actinomycetota bacterium]
MTRRNSEIRRFEIVHRGPYRWLGVALGARSAAVEVDDVRIVVTYGPWFRAEVPRDAVASVTLDERRTISRGVHGWRGRWLVNGAGDGLVRIFFEPEQRARTIGFRVRLVELVVNVADPAALIEAIRPTPVG